MYIVWNCQCQWSCMAVCQCVDRNLLLLQYILSFFRAFKWFVYNMFLMGPRRAFYADENLNFFQQRYKLFTIFWWAVSILTSTTFDEKQLYFDNEQQKISYQSCITFNWAVSNWHQTSTFWYRTAKEEIKHGTIRNFNCYYDWSGTRFDGKTVSDKERFWSLINQMPNNHYEILLQISQEAPFPEKHLRIGGCQGGAWGCHQDVRGVSPNIKCKMRQQQKYK